MYSDASNSRSPFTPFLLIAPFFFWGTAMVAMKGVIPTTTPFFLAGVRLMPAGILVLGVGILTGRPQPKSWQAWFWIGLFALVDGTLFQGFLAEGLVRIDAGLGSVMIDTQPLAVAVMARIFFGELVGPWGWLGLGIGLTGISLLGLPEAWIFDLAHGHLPNGAGAMVGNFFPTFFESGEGLMLFAALSMAVGTILIRAVCQYADPIVATGWHMVLGGFPLFACSGYFETEQWSHLSVTGWMALVYSTIFGSAIAYGLFFYLASRENLTSFSSLTFLTPIFALLFGNLFLSEMLTPIQWGGVSLALFSIYLINQRNTLGESWAISALSPLKKRLGNSGNTEEATPSSQKVEAQIKASIEATLDD